jgi:Tat protein translocase TatB subunit
MFLFILESVGTTELLVILGAALVFFGPRRLPQLSRQLGKSLTEFRRASEDFKRTWEREVNLENVEKGVEPQKDNSILEKAAERMRSAREAAARDITSPTDPAASLSPSVTPVDPSLVQPHASQTIEPESSEAAPALSKHDWL